MAGKELVLFCIVMLHISSMVSRPVESGMLKENVKSLVNFSLLCNLLEAENHYAKELFLNNPPKEYELGTFEPIEGITFGNTTEEIQASICAIPDYLGKHLPAVLENLTKHKDAILNLTRKFLTNFNSVISKSYIGQNETSVPKECHRNVTTLDDYTKKVKGLRIIYSTRRWVETFTGITSHCYNVKA